jgi:hypothetical protein
LKPRRVLVRQPSAKVAAEPLDVARRVQQPVVPIRPIVLATVGEQSAQLTTQNEIIAARWPDPAKANGRVASATALTNSVGADAGSTSGAQSDVPAQDSSQSSAEAVSTAEAPLAIDPQSMLALLASVLVISGVGGVTFRHFGLRRRRRPNFTVPAYTARNPSLRDGSILSIVRRASAVPAPGKARRIPEGSVPEAAAAMSREEDVAPVSDDVDRRHPPDMLETAEVVDRWLRELDLLAPQRADRREERPECPIAHRIS